MKQPLPLPPELDKDMFTLYRLPERGEFFLVFVDTAGEGSDNNAGQFLSKQKLDIPLVLSYSGSIVDVTPKIKSALEWIYDMTGVKPIVAYETNNGGGYELDRLDRLNKADKYTIYYQYELDSTGKLVKSDKKGWNTSGKTRPVMISGVEEVVNNHLITIYDRPTVTEFFSFVKKKTSSGWKAEAESGAHDDRVMSLAGVWQLYQTEEPEAPINSYKAEQAREAARRIMEQMRKI